MTDLKALTGQRFWMYSDDWGACIWEVMRVRLAARGPFAEVGCQVVDWGAGKVYDDQHLRWIAAHDVADAIRVQYEPEPRYPVATRQPDRRVRALITRTGCPLCGDPDLKPSDCPGRGHPR